MQRNTALVASGSEAVAASGTAALHKVELMKNSILSNLPRKVVMCLTRILSEACWWLPNVSGQELKD